MNNVSILAADASRGAALLVACIRPVCALLAPCRAGASTPKIADVIHLRVLTAMKKRLLLTWLLLAPAMPIAQGSGPGVNPAMLLRPPVDAWPTYSGDNAVNYVGHGRALSVTGTTARPRAAFA